MGLLNYLTATSMDEDYEHVSRVRSTRSGASMGTPGRVAVVVLAAFGVLVATAGLQTARSADITANSHDELVKQVITRKAQLSDRRDLVDSLESEVRTLRSVQIDAAVADRAVQSRLASLGVEAGALPTVGPGITIEVDNGPASDDKAEILDVDLQRMVNGLWEVGAEAISINGQRLTALTAVRTAGSSVTVNLQRISPPYTLSVIGDPGTLPSDFIDTPGGQWWLDLRSLYGVRFEINVPDERVTLPAAARLVLRYAHIPDEEVTPR